MVILNTLVPVSFFIIALLAIFADKEKIPKLSTYQITIITLIILAVCTLIFTSLYIQWTKAESEAIRGVQGRYFIPILPLVFILLSKIKVKIDYDETKIIKFIAMGILMLQIYIVPLVYCIRK